MSFLSACYKKISTLYGNNAALIGALPDDTRVYCIGDVHGCYHLLHGLVAQITQDRQGFLGRVLIIYLGDLIDRGPHSKQVIDFLLASQDPAVEYIYLRGNHEQTLLDFWDDPQVIRHWLLYGGLATLISYDIHPHKIPSKINECVALQTQFKAQLPDTHYRFFSQSRLVYELGNYFFVHAGINPQRSLHEQQIEDLLWIREPFLDFNKPYEKIIVHGHSIVDKVNLFAHRIGVDTGAFMSQVLSCLVLEGNEQRVLQTSSVLSND